MNKQALSRFEFEEELYRSFDYILRLKKTDVKISMIF
ncbi:hypothetical protein SPPR111872_12565 [Sphingobacterium prati]